MQANSVDKKITNWQLLNRKVLAKLGCRIDESTINNLARAVSFEIEKLLIRLKSRFESAFEMREAASRE